MRYHLEHVVLDLPHVLIDETTYAFEHKKHGLSLFVSFEPPSPGVTPDMVLDDMSESLTQGFQGMCHPHFRKPLTFQGEPAAQAYLQLGLAIGGGEVHLLAATGARQLTLLKFLTAQETTGGQGQAMFEHILGSVAPAREPWSRKGAQGYVRRQAGPLTLEMPEVLGAPRGFCFATLDGLVRLTLQYAEGAAPAGAPVFEEVLPPQPPESRLDTHAAEEKPFSSAAGLTGTSGRWELRSMAEKQELERYWVRTLSVALPGGRTLQALGVARASGSATLDAAWTQLTTTLRLED